MRIIKQGESVLTRVHYVTCEKCFCKYEAQENEGNTITDGAVFKCPSCSAKNTSLFRDIEWQRTNKEYEEHVKKCHEQWDNGSWWTRFCMESRDGHHMV